MRKRWGEWDVVEVFNDDVHPMRPLDLFRRTLSGRCERMPGIAGKVYVFVPSRYRPHVDSPPVGTSSRLAHVGGGLWVKELQFDDASAEWSIPFDGPDG